VIAMHWLPAGQNGAPDGSSPVSSSDPSARQTPQEIRVLVVEDEWLVSMEIEMVLEDAGHTVIGVAISADAAVRLAEMHRPDLVLMDIRLQGTRDGIDAAIEIHGRLGIRCLFVSAHSDPTTRERAQAASPVGWLDKPFTGTQLLLAIEAGLRELG
jgi:two-component system, response regulator PdtaR